MTTKERARKIAKMRDEIIRVLDEYTREEFDEETVENDEQIYGVAFTEIFNGKGDKLDMQVSMDLKNGGLDYEYNNESGNVREVFIPYTLTDLLDIARSYDFNEFCMDGVDHAPRGYGFA